MAKPSPTYKKIFEQTSKIELISVNVLTTSLFKLKTLSPTFVTGWKWYSTSFLISLSDVGILAKTYLYIPSSTFI